jgi:hypothetical protein
VEGQFVHPTNAERRRQAAVVLLGDVVVRRSGPLPLPRREWREMRLAALQARAEAVAQRRAIERLPQMMYTEEHVTADVACQCLRRVMAWVGRHAGLWVVAIVLTLPRFEAFAHCDHLGDHSPGQVMEPSRSLVLVQDIDAGGQGPRGLRPAGRRRQEVPEGESTQMCGHRGQGSWYIDESQLDFDQVRPGGWVEW